MATVLISRFSSLVMAVIFSQVRVKVKLLFRECHRCVSVHRHPKILTLEKLRVSVQKLDVRSILRDRITTRLHFPLDNLDRCLVIVARLHGNREPKTVQPHHPCLHRFVVVHGGYILMPSGFLQVPFFYLSPSCFTQNPKSRKRRSCGFAPRANNPRSAYKFPKCRRKRQSDTPCRHARNRHQTPCHHCSSNNQCCH